MATTTTDQPIDADKERPVETEANEPETKTSDVATKDDTADKQPKQSDIEQDRHTPQDTPKTDDRLGTDEDDKEVDDEYQSATEDSHAGADDEKTDDKSEPPSEEKETPVQDKPPERALGEEQDDRLGTDEEDQEDGDDEESATDDSRSESGDEKIDDKSEESGSEEKEELAQDKQPERPLDDDEDRRNPQYIPKKGHFYEHDDRAGTDEEDQEDEEVGDEEESVTEESHAAGGDEKADEKSEERGSEGKKERVQVLKKPVTANANDEPAPRRQKKLWSSEDRWGHDKFDADEQKPKSRDELMNQYGYDIRNEDNAPKSVRRRRYGRGPAKYTRNWQDEDAYSGQHERRGSRGGERGPRKENGTERRQRPRHNDERRETNDERPIRRDRKDKRDEQERRDQRPFRPERRGGDHPRHEHDDRSGLHDNDFPALPGNKSVPKQPRQPQRQSAWNNNAEGRRESPRKENAGPMRSLTFENTERFNKRIEERRTAGQDDREPRDQRNNASGERRSYKDRNDRGPRYSNRDRDQDRNFENNNDRKPPRRDRQERDEHRELRRPKKNQNNDRYQQEEDLAAGMGRINLDNEAGQQQGAGGRQSKRYSSLRQQRSGDNGGQYDPATIPSQALPETYTPGTPGYDQGTPNSQHSPGYYESAASQPVPPAALANHSPAGSFSYDSPTGYDPRYGGPAPPMAPVIPAPAGYPHMPSYPPSGYPQYPPPAPASYIPAGIPPPLQQGPPPAPLATEMAYRGGVTYYDPSIQQPRNVLQKRPKTVLPIVPPPGQQSDVGDQILDSKDTVHVN